MDVGRNLAEGRGLVQSTLGYNQVYLMDADSKIPSPFTIQPPIYPLCIAGLIKLNIPADQAALIIPVIAYAITILLVYHLMLNTFSAQAALLMSGILLILPQIKISARVALADTLGAMFIILTMTLLLHISRKMRTDGISKPLYWRIGLAGITAGCSFATKYMLLPFAGLGFLFLLVETWHLKSNRNKYWINAFPILSIYSMGVLLPVAPVLIHNWLAIGQLISPTVRSNLPLMTNLIDLLYTLTGVRILLKPWPGLWLPASLFGFSGLIFGMAIYVKIAAKMSLRKFFIHDGRYLLTLWMVGFPTFVVGLRTIVNFDVIGSRFLLPSIYILIMFLVVMGEQMLRRLSFYQTLPTILFTLCVILALISEVQVLKQPIVSAESHIQNSQTLSWIRTNTTEDDLVIGNDFVDIPFYLGRHAAVSYSSFPYTNRMTYDQLMRFYKAHKNQFQRVYLIVDKPNPKKSLASHLYQFGPFIVDLSNRQIQQYTGIKLVQELANKTVYQVGLNNY